MFRTLSDTMLAAPQISPDDVARAAAEGITLIVNNRPDDEAPGQPAGAAIQGAAKDAGIDYLAIPVTHAGFSLPQVEAMREAIENNKGKTLAFCRSGTRSTLLWALARVHMGDDPDAVEAAADEAGYSVAPVRSIMDAFHMAQ
ncbi:MAG: TIGR01244 family phosphatase [Sphingomonadaceae bacterium]|nr:TIGR01244 family phosphatase [Sphingomonadaceae bacterium]